MLGQLSELKEKLELLEKNLSNKVGDINTLEKKWETYEERMKDVLDTKEEDIVWINVGGKKFATKISTLLRVKDNLFHKIIQSKRMDISKGIFIDRSPTYFNHILDYLRYGKFNPKKFNKDQLLEIKDEIQYYELLELEEQFEKKKNYGEFKYVKLEVSAFYNDYDGNQVGQTDVKVLLDKNLSTGICANNPAWIILEFNDEYEFDSFDLGGYTGSADWIYSEGYGVGARIETSLDKKTWNYVGTLAGGWGQSIKNIKVTKSTAKYLKLSGVTWLGIGYLKPCLE